MDLKGPKLRSGSSRSLGSWGSPLRPELEVRGGHVDQKLPLIGGPSRYFYTFTRVWLVTWRTSGQLLKGSTSPQLGHCTLYTCEQGRYPILWEVWPWPYNCSPHEGKLNYRLAVTTNFHSNGNPDCQKSTSRGPLNHHYPYLTPTQPWSESDKHQVSHDGHLWWAKVPQATNWRVSEKCMSEGPYLIRITW
jgi:hypothetical protein